MHTCANISITSLYLPPTCYDHGRACHIGIGVVSEVWPLHKLPTSNPQPPLPWGRDLGCVWGIFLWTGGPSSLIYGPSSQVGGSELEERHLFPPWMWPICEVNNPCCASLCHCLHPCSHLPPLPWERRSGWAG